MRIAINVFVLIVFVLGMVSCCPCMQPGDKGDKESVPEETGTQE